MIHSPDTRMHVEECFHAREQSTTRPGLTYSCVDRGRSGGGGVIGGGGGG